MGCTDMGEEGRDKRKTVKRVTKRCRGTWVVCPNCGKKSHVRVRVGEAQIHCKGCKADFEVTIRLIEEEEPE